MSEADTIVSSGQRYRELAGIGIRCQLVYDALLASSPRSWRDLLDDLEDALGAADLRRPPETPFADDLRALQAARLIERVPGAPDLFRPVS